MPETICGDKDKNGKSCHHRAYRGGVQSCWQLLYSSSQCFYWEVQGSTSLPCGRSMWEYTGKASDLILKCLNCNWEDRLELARWTACAWGEISRPSAQNMQRSRGNPKEKNTVWSHWSVEGLREGGEIKEVMQHTYYAIPTLETVSDLLLSSGEGLVLYLDFQVLSNPVDCAWLSLAPEAPTNTHCCL